ncbi:MAG: DegT/DnrJ/EryC1/StrS family aminotransferase [Chloroflexota bacterium]
MTTPREVPFARPALGQEEIDAVADTIRSGWITLGPKTKRFEQEFARYLGVPEAVALSSGTAGLHLAFAALGLGPGDEVIVPTYTFASTAISVMHVGATPVLVDVDPRTLTLTAETARAAITPRTKAIVPVHIAGTACDMDPLLDLARRHDLKVVEDAAHALPTRYDGRLIGTLGDITVFSFYATKTLATGDGGMLVADDAALRKKIRVLSLHGMDADAWGRYGKGGTWRYDVTAPGFKYNMTDLAAAIGIEQLRKLDAHTARRTEIAEAFTRGLVDLPGLALPVAGPRATHAWHLYLVRFDATRCGFTRDQAHERLRENGIGTSVHFIPLHQFSLFRKTAPGPFPVADLAFSEVLSLPIYPGMSAEDVAWVIEAIRSLWNA